MNYCYPKYTHIVLWGSETLDSQRAFLAFNNYYEIDSFITKNVKPKSGFWNNVPYINIDQFIQKNRNRSQKIIITLRKSEPWKEYVEYLFAKGLKFFDDFNLYFLMDEDIADVGSISQIITDENECASVIKKFAGSRKVFYINGNCQTGLLCKYLLANQTFNSRYLYMELPRVCQVNASVEKLYDIALLCADLCLSQSISMTNRFSAKLSTQYIREHLRSDARLIIIPKLHFQGYFPQFKSVQDDAVMLGKTPVFAYGDKYIDELLERGECCENIIKKILDPDFLSAEKINQFFNEQLTAYMDEEQVCNVKIYDYVLENSRKEILWHSFNHPANKVIKELAIRTLMEVGIAREAAIRFMDGEGLDGMEGLRGQMQLIYPSVYKALGIVPDDRKYLINTNSSTLRLGKEDYIRVYCNSHNTNVPIIDIWGSCVSRELFNFTNKFKVGAYILQNPVHTFWRDPVEIAEESILGTSNFTRRMAVLEFEKKSKEYFDNNFQAKYLMIDLCDCRNDVYVFRDKEKETLISDSISIEKTVAGLEGEKPEKHSVFEISDSYWEESLDRFVELIKSRYEEENIIINEFRFAEKYYDVDGIIKEFAYNDLYHKRGELIKKLEDKLKKKLPLAKVISPVAVPLGYGGHKIGLSPMHYIDECYYAQILKLERLFGMNSVTDDEISVAYREMMKFEKMIEEA